MSKLELSINVEYLPNWHAWEGIRELVQNGIDAETEFNAPLKVTHHNGTLRIENEGATLSREALLFGTTSKAGRGDMIGKFGEGLKLGVLALVRSGRQVKIRTGDEVWRAYIARSERYDADVLHFEIKGGNENKRRVRVEISDVSEADWAGLKDRFLFLARVKKDESVDTDRGDLLLGERFKGQVFVRGIYVQTDNRLAAGYNFQRAEVDRDRKMISGWDLEWEASQVWAEAVAKRPDLLDPFFDLMLNFKPDVAGLAHNATYAPDATKQGIAKAFTKKFGEGVVPVANLAESAEVEHLGKRGVVVSKPLGALLATTMGTKDEIQKQMREEVVKTLSWSDVNDDQRKALFDALMLVSSVRPECKLDLIDLVEFRSATLLGQFKNGRILLASKLLDDPHELLATLVHEYSHREGGDGEKGHVMAIENLWRDIVKHLRGSR